MFPSFIGLMTLYIIIVLLSSYFYFKFEDDIWFQALWAITGFMTFAFLFVTAYFVTNLQMENPISHGTILPDGIDYDTDNYVQEFFDSDEVYHFYYWNTDLLEQDVIKRAEICFRYNNTDGENRVEFVGGDFIVATRTIFVDDNVGDICIQVTNLSCIKDCNFFGFHCQDCEDSNGIYLLQDNDSSLVPEIEVNISTTPVGVDYQIVDEKAHLMKINYRALPKNEINRFFFLYVSILGFLLLSFALRGIIKIISGEADEMMRDI